MAEGGLTPDEQDRKIMEHMEHVRIAAKVALRKLSRYLELEDLLQYGRVGLVEAARAFDPRQGWKFLTFARHRIRGAMYNAYAARAADEERVKALACKAGHDCQATQVRPGDVMLDMDGKAEDRAVGHGELIMAGMFTAGMFAASAGAYKPGTPEAALRMHRLMRRGVASLPAALAKLPDRDRRLIEAYYLEGTPMEEIAAELKISLAGAYRQRDRILQRMKRLLALVGVDELPPTEEEL